MRLTRFDTQFNSIGQKLTLELQTDFKDLEVITPPDSCNRCPVGFSCSGRCGRNVPFQPEDYERRPDTCRLQEVQMYDDGKVRVYLGHGQLKSIAISEDMSVEVSKYFKEMAKPYIIQVLDDIYEQLNKEYQWQDSRNNYLYLSMQLIEQKRLELGGKPNENDSV